MKPLDTILDTMPASIEHREINLFVNDALGLDPKKVPKSFETYGMSMIMRHMRQRGYIPVWKKSRKMRDNVIATDKTYWTKVPPYKWNGEYERRA